MGKLIYSMLTSLDGYTEDEHGRFGWGAPEDEEVHSYINALASSLGTYLYGRRMYETMVYWEAAHTIPDQPQFVLDWARQWQAAEKIVYSRTLAGPRSARTRVERGFDPDAVRRLKADAEHDISVDGPELAAQAIRGGLVDEFQMVVCPAVVGVGKRFFPDGVRLDLELVEERRFGIGVLILRYAVRGAARGLTSGVKPSEILPA
jgi:dihydrofolate reductase